MRDDSHHSPGERHRARREEHRERWRGRRERRHSETRAEILDAACEVLLERGAADLSLREIARRAGFSPGALYKYFASKDDLLKALADKALGALAAEFARVPPGLPADERAVEIGVAFLEFARQNPEDAAVIAAHEASIHAQPLSAEHRLVEETIVGVFRDGREAGVFDLPDAEDAETAAYGAWAFARGLAAFQQGHDSRVAEQLHRKQRQLLGVYVNGLKAGWSDQS